MFLHPTLTTFLQELAKERPVAADFLDHYAYYCGSVDDVVDEGSEHAKECARRASSVYNHDYWKRWGHVLILLEKIIINQYFDSVKWEKAEEEWKRQHAKVNSHAGMMMTFAVVLIEYGDKKLDEVSLAWREQAYMMHKEDKV
jgi:hypothetical protein